MRVWSWHQGMCCGTSLHQGFPPTAISDPPSPRSIVSAVQCRSAGSEIRQCPRTTQPAPAVETHPMQMRAVSTLRYPSGGGYKNRLETRQVSYSFHREQHGWGKCFPAQKRLDNLPFVGKIHPIPSGCDVELEYSGCIQRFLSLGSCSPLCGTSKCRATNPNIMLRITTSEPASSRGQRQRIG